MGTFVRIKKVATFKKVVYYSVVLTGSDDEEVLENSTESLFEDFRKRMAIHNKKLTHILSWLKEIGNTRGAREEDFRHEKSANALPPKDKGKDPAYIEKGKKASNNLRLYCLRLNKHVVFLFNGDIKTADTAQECPQVSPHFDVANLLAIQINQLFISKDIFWINDDKNIDFDDNLIFEI